MLIYSTEDRSLVLVELGERSKPNAKWQHAERARQREKATRVWFIKSGSLEARSLQLFTLFTNAALVLQRDQIVKSAWEPRVLPAFLITSSAKAGQRLRMDFRRCICLYSKYSEANNACMHRVHSNVYIYRIEAESKTRSVTHAPATTLTKQSSSFRGFDGNTGYDLKKQRVSKVFRFFLFYGAKSWLGDGFLVTFLRVWEDCLQ